MHKSHAIFQFILNLMYKKLKLYNNLNEKNFIKIKPNIIKLLK